MRTESGSGTRDLADTRCLVTDFGGTISSGRVDHVLGQKPVDPAAAAALRVLHEAGLRIVLASNTAGPEESRWPALALAGIDDVFSCALLSYPMQVSKPAKLFYQLALTAAQCPARQVLWVGDSLANDAAGPVRHGMRAALVRPGGLRPGEHLPPGAVVIEHVADLPALICGRPS